MIIQNPHGKSEVVGIVADVHNQGLDQGTEASRSTCRCARARAQAWPWSRAPSRTR